MELADTLRGVLSVVADSDTASAFCGYPHQVKQRQRASGMGCVSIFPSAFVTGTVELPLCRHDSLRCALCRCVYQTKAIQVPDGCCSPLFFYWHRWTHSFSRKHKVFASTVSELFAIMGGNLAVVPLGALSMA